MPDSPVIRRHVVRLVVLDDADRLLLIRSRDPAEPDKGEWWELPGGGIGRGETPEAAGLRELREETGITAATVGGCLWTDVVEFTFGGYAFAQDQRYHLARVDAGAPVGRTDLEALEEKAFLRRAWFSAADVVAAARAGERFLPPWLPGALPEAISGTIPRTPKPMSADYAGSP